MYERYVGEPDSMKDVYGYWLFIAGYIVSFTGIGLYLSGLPHAGGVNEFMWRVSVTLAAVGLPLAMLGIVLLLPVRERGIQTTLVGAAISGLGILAFNVAYPANWRRGADYTAEVVAIYALGLAIIAGVAVLVPVVTGKQGMFVEDELLNIADQPPVLLGEASSGALFSVFRTPDKYWTWRAIRQDAVADGTQHTGSRADAKEVVETVREVVSGAGLLEITTAAFRLYENEGSWRWVLMGEDGGVVAESGETYPGRDGVEASVSFAKDHAPSAPLIEIEGAAVDYYRSGDSWRWRLLGEDRSVLAGAVEDHPDRASATSAVEAMQKRIGNARVLALSELGVELYPDDDGWRWRLLDADDNEIAVSTTVHEERRIAESETDAILDGLSDATTVERGIPGFEVYPDDGWQWRLLDSENDVLARSHSPDATPDVLYERAEAMAETAIAAGVAAIDGADYEIYPDDGGWHWRFVAEDRTVIADRRGGYDSPESARAVIETVREQAREADLLEYEAAAFQQYRTDDGSWRWRLIEKGGAVLADSGEAYESKADAGAAMTTLKETAPNADILEIETAAFELVQVGVDGWRWRLIDEGGFLVAEGATTHSSRQDARAAMDSLIMHSPDAAVREMSEPLFQLYDDGDDWRWRYVTVDNEIIADGTETHSTRDEAASHVEDVRAIAADSTVDLIEFLLVELSDGGDWDFELFDASRKPLANGSRTYEGRQGVETEVGRLKSHGADAPIFEIEDAAIRIYEDEAGFGWQLIDRERATYARNETSYPSLESAIEAVEQLTSLGPDADEIEFDQAGFEFFEDDGNWHWRLLDGDELIVAVGATPYESQTAVRERLETVREFVAEASVLEIDDPAFELHYREDGWIWRLVDADGEALAESSLSYPTRSEAREAMQTLKEQAPDGHVTVAQ